MATDLVPRQPTGKVLDMTNLSAKPQEGLAEVAPARSQVVPRAERAAAGSAGGYQIQVASFRDESEANAYVEHLHLRGYRAHTETVPVPNQGLWYRVRLGPFKTEAQAVAYKMGFERKENMTSILVEPEKVPRRERAGMAPPRLSESSSEQRTDYVLPRLVLDEQAGVALEEKWPEQVPSDYADYINRYVQAGAAASHCTDRTASQLEARIQVTIEGLHEVSAPEGATIAAAALDAVFLESGFAGTEFGNCVLEKFRMVVHPPFEGPARTLVIPLKFGAE